MPGPKSKDDRKRRRRAKATVDFATGEVHDLALDAAGNPRALAQVQGVTPADPDQADLCSPEELSNENRAQLDLDRAKRPRRARTANQHSRRAWIKARKIP
jgi:hypothetical protein